MQVLSFPPPLPASNRPRRDAPRSPPPPVSADPRTQVLNALTAQYDVDPVQIELRLNDAWARNGHFQETSVTADEFLRPKFGILARLVQFLPVVAGGAACGGVAAGGGAGRSPAGWLAVPSANRQSLFWDQTGRGTPHAGVETPQPGGVIPGGARHAPARGRVGVAGGEEEAEEVEEVKREAAGEEGKGDGAGGGGGLWGEQPVAEAVVVAEVDPEVAMAEAVTEAAGGDETKGGEGTNARPQREPPVAIGERVEILWTHSRRYYRATVTHCVGEDGGRWAVGIQYKIDMSEMYHFMDGGADSVTWRMGWAPRRRKRA